MARAVGLGRWLTAVVVMLAGCAGHPDATVDAPPAPDMPPGWEVVSDMSFPADEIARVGRNLGGELASLRNTVYEVNGKRVQLNMIEAATPAAGDRIMLRLRDMKHDEFLLRRGTIIYEFVCANDAMAEARAGRAHLEATLAAG